MSNLSLYFLGSPQIELDGDMITISYSKAMALLIYLAVTGESQRRDTLATLLWPESGQQIARSSLRRELSLLNKALVGDWLIADRETIGLSPNIWIDVAEFENYLAESKQDKSSTINSLSEVNNLYRADFVSGFTLPNCSEFDEWQFFQAQQLRHKFANSLKLLVSELISQHDYETAIPYTRRWLSLDSLHEPAHQMLMKLYAFSGRQAAALRQFSECQQLLRNELGIEPDAETRELEIAIRERRFKQADKQKMVLTPSIGVGDETLLDQAPDEPRPLFVGREPQISTLGQALEHTLKKEGQLRLITGEAGAGKSALVSEFIYRSQPKQREILVTTGFCDAQTGAIDPYLPFREAFKALLINQDTKQHVREITSNALLEHGPQLLNVVVPSTEIEYVINIALQAGWKGDIPKTSSQDIEQSKIFEQVVAVLQGIAVHFPLILVLEDLHWADSGSIGILFRLARQLVDHQILVIGTYRPEAVRPDKHGESHPLEKMALELQRNMSDIRIDLDVARVEEGQSFVDGVLDAESNRLGMSFRKALRHQTGGHPLFVVELLQELKKNSVLIQDDEEDWIMASDVDWLSLPTRVEGAIGGRMSHLSEEQRWFLTIASVMGENFLVEVVAHIAGENTRQLSHTFSQSLQTEHRLVEAEGVERSGEQRLTVYRFRHNLIQVYLYERLDKVQRVYLHEDIAHTLEALYAEDIERIALPLAHHYEMAGMTQKAVDYLRITGDKAVRFGASLEAVQHFSHALSLLNDLQKTTEQQEQSLELQFRLAEVYDRINSAGSDTLEAFNKALTLARQLNNTRILVLSLVALTNLAQNRAELELAQAYGEECLQQAEASQDPELLMRTNLALFYLALGSGKYSDAAAHMEEAISFYRNHRTDLSADDVYNFATNLGLCAIVLAPAGFPEKALRYAQEGLALAKKYDHHFGVACVLGLVSVVHKRSGEYEEALHYGEAMIEASQASNLLNFQTYGELHKGSSLAMLGNPDEGSKVVRQAIAKREAMNMHFGHFGDLAYAGLGYGLVGEVEKGLALIDEAMSKIDASSDHQEDAFILRLKGDLLLMQELSDDEAKIAQQQAEAVFRQAINIAHERQTKLWEARALASLCRLLESQGRDEGCRQQLAELYDWFTEGFETEDLRFVRTVLEEV